MLAGRWQLAGPLVQRRGGGFAFACPQVLGGGGVHVGLGDISLRFVMVAHVNSGKTASIADMGLAVLAALCRLLWLNPAAHGGATRVVLQLVDDLRTVG